MNAQAYLEKAAHNGASDVFLLAGSPAMEKVGGKIRPLDDQKLFINEMEELITQIYEHAGRSMDEYDRRGDDDFSFALPGIARFRVNAYRQRGSKAMVIRVVPFDIPDWQKLNIPEEVMKVANTTSGLVLVTGTAGTGKSATQACIINEINRSRESHIITLEDPIEYLHRHNRSIISQREVAVDTRDYLSALRACLRQAPDVILLGEMRDYETISTAMTAAETGHLVIATLHTRGAVNTIDRILDSFPSAQQGQVRIQLSSVLRTVISQQLLPTVDGGRIPAFEIMHTDNAIRNMIRDNKNHQINSAIAAGSAAGMISMDQYILSLYQKKVIDRNTALSFCDNPDQMAKKL